MKYENYSDYRYANASWPFVCFCPFFVCSVMGGCGCVYVQSMSLVWVRCQEAESYHLLNLYKNLKCTSDKLWFCDWLFD